MNRGQVIELTDDGVVDSNFRECGEVIEAGL